MKSTLFDQGYFTSRVEGNLPMLPGSHLRKATISRGDRALSYHNIPVTSILGQPMRSYSCPSMPAPTLDSFAAFADSYDDAVAQELAGTADSPSSPMVRQPAAVKGNSVLDSISGSIGGAIASIGGAYAKSINTNQPVNSNQLLQAYLQGKLPGATLNAQGQVVPKATTNWTPIILIAVALGGLGMVMSRK